MAKQLLIETKMGALSLQEGVQSKHPNCLGTIKGPCADYDSATRNNNFYSRKLWENVFKDPLVKEALEDRVLLGELDHPGDRLETKATNACIVMTDYEFDDNNKVVIGTFDILDTPNGRILRSLLDYGCKIGVSSRGEGDVTEDAQGRNVVAEDGSYYFVAFDSVVLPAVKKAKPALQESLQKNKTLKESLAEQVNLATTKSELDLIKKVLESTELPDVDSLLESIDNKSKELEGSNNSSNLIEDLERMTTLSNTLTEENKKLKQDLINRESRIQRFVESHCEQMTTNSQLESRIKKLKEDYSKVVSDLNQSSRRLESIKKQYENLKSTNSSLEEQLRAATSKSSEYESKIDSLEEALEKSQKVCRDRSKKIRDLSEELKNSQEEYEAKLQECLDRESQVRAQVKEAKSSLKESQSSNKKLSSTYNGLLTTYLSTRAKDLGIDPSKLVESLKPSMSTSDIDKLLEEEVDRKDRYRQVPIATDPLINSLAKNARVSVNTDRLNEEDSQAVAFMQEYYKINK